MDDRELGLYGKYEVRRLGDVTGKHDDCWFFVLDMDHDKYALTALAAYALACRDEYPQLANDLWAYITDSLDEHEDDQTNDVH